MAAGWTEYLRKACLETEVEDNHPFMVLINYQKKFAGVQFEHFSADTTCQELCAVFATREIVLLYPFNNAVSLPHN